jgi:anti-anti-sigma regulatory factor
MAQEGAVFIGKYGSSFIFKAEGRLTQKLLGNVNVAVRQCTEDESITDLLIDITDCQYMDSTILGIVARWALSFTQAHATHPFLLGLPGSPLEKIFKRMHLNTLFHVSQDIQFPNNHALSCVSLSDHVTEKEYAEYLLSAHETLAKLSEENAKEFADVIQCLKAELQGK